MKKHLKYLIGFLGLTLCLLPVSYARDLAFDEALSVLRSSNEAILASQMEISERKHELLAAKGLDYPRIQAGARYTALNDPIMIDLNDIRTVMLSLHPNVPSQLIPSFESNVQDQQYWKANVSVTWPVYTGGRITAAKQAAEARQEESQEKLRSTESGLTSELTRRYFGLRLAEKVAVIRKQVLDAMNRHLQEAVTLENTGVIARVERLHAEVSVAEADRLHMRAIRDVSLARTALESILSMQEPVVPTSALFISSDLEPLDFYSEQALSNNPVLGQISAQCRQANAGIKKEVGAFLPEVYLFGIRELYTQDLTVLDPEWAVGVGLNWTIFEGLSGSNRLKAARFVEKKARFLEQRAKQDIVTLVEKRYQELMKALEQYNAIAASLNLTKEFVRIRQRAFEEGIATSLDVVDAQLALSRVLVERLNAAFEFDVALSELLETCGMSDSLTEYSGDVSLSIERL
jgi:outer membrane protein TolC